MQKVEILPKLFIELMFGERSASTCTTVKSSGIYYTTHKDINDRVWECKFKFKGDKVKWGMSSGRWRELKEDIKLSYKWNGGSVTLTETIPDETPSSITKCIKGLQ